MNKLKEWAKQPKVRGMLKKIGVVACAAVMMAMSVIGVSADESSDTVAGIKSVTDSITSQFSISTIASIVGIVLAGCVGLFLFWWGARKVVRMIVSAFKKGRISL